MIRHTQRFFCSHDVVDISFADHPYTLVLDGTLEAPLPLPGVEIPLSTPSDIKSKIEKEEEPQESKKTHAHSEESGSESMNEEKARAYMSYGKTETIYEEELMLRYKKRKKDPAYANIQYELKVAFHTLLKIAA